VADKTWKQFERECADYVRGDRYWSNSGKAVDVEGPTHIGQCKLVKRMSLEELTTLVEELDQLGHEGTHPKRGVVFVKLKRGKGRQSVTLAVMPADSWATLYNS
jgi:hypothetical protein